MTNSGISTILGASFGYSDGSRVEDSSRAVCRIYNIKKINKVIGVILLISSIALGALSLLGQVHFALALGVFGAYLVKHAITKFYIDMLLYQSAGLVISNKALEGSLLNPQEGVCQAIATENSADTEWWRERLVESAEKNIILSGNYCDGQAFIRFLNCVKKRIAQRPALKVVILAHPLTLKGEALRTMRNMQEEYPENISWVETGSIWHMKPGLKKTTNHTKCMVIDNGRAFILGGSGIKNNFVGTGVDDLTKEEFVARKEIATDELSTSEFILTDSETTFSTIIDNVMLGEYRDQDWVFMNNEDDNPVGFQLFLQALLLAHRWEGLNSALENSWWGKTQENSIENFGVLNGEEGIINPEDTITTQLLKTPVNIDEYSDTVIPAFEVSTQKASDVACSIFSSGPEHAKSAYQRVVLDAINNAEETIMINHMYFHPTTKVMDALIAAVNRGVKITIITNGEHEAAPRSHRIFGPRNKYNYSKLVNSVPKELRENIKIHEFTQTRKGNHKKLIIVDESTIVAGSSNLGYKSLVTSSDHEINFIARSQKLAEETLKVCYEDIKHSQLKEHNPQEDMRISWGEYLRAKAHQLCGFLIG